MKWLRNYLSVRRTTIALERLSPHQLEDIGLTHGDIYRVSRGRYAGIRV